MFKTTPPCEAQAPVGATAASARPLSHRVLAGLLAATLTLSSCGSGYDAEAEGGSKTAPAVIDSATTLPVGALSGWQTEFQSDEPAAAEVSKRLEANATEAGGGTSMGGCVHSIPYAVTNLTDKQKYHIRGLWTEYDPSTGGARGVTLHSGQADFIHVKQHISPYVRQYLEGAHQYPVEYRVSYRSMNVKHASWDMRLHHRVSSRAECDRIKGEILAFEQGGGKRKLQELKAGEPVPWEHRLIAHFVGLVLTVGTTVAVSLIAPEALGGWAAATAGCLVGISTGVTLAYLFGRTEDHTAAWIDMAANCVGAFAGAGTVKSVAWINKNRELIRAFPGTLRAAFRGVGVAANALRERGAIEPAERVIEMVSRSAERVLERVPVAPGTN